MAEAAGTSEAARAGTAAHVLVVDDEPSLRDVLATSLRFLGYDVAEAATGRDALAAIRGRRPDLVLLDVMLPDLDGFEVVRRLRAEGGPGAVPPVVFLTARESPSDVVDGFDLGADDYVTKPFRLQEVAVRVRAVLRRAVGEHRGPGTSVGTSVGPGADATLRCADLALDPVSREVHRGGVLLDLSPTEYRLLHHLLGNAGRTLTKEQLLSAVWDFGESDPAVLKTYVSYLRRKLDAHGPPLIHTRRGVGYLLRAPRPTDDPPPGPAQAAGPAPGPA